jgi:hypothetical protein
MYTFESMTLVLNLQHVVTSQYEPIITYESALERLFQKSFLSSQLILDESQSETRHKHVKNLQVIISIT